MSELKRYEIFDDLGGNHFCQVYKARDHRADRWVAIMELQKRLSENPDAWRKVWKEVLERIEIKHEYAVAVYDVLEDQRSIVVEFMEGNLQQALDELPLRFEAVRTILMRSLEALGWMHSRGKTHGDVRPATLLFDRAGAVKISFSPGLTIGGSIPSESRDFKYVAPEMLSDSFGEIGHAVDLYCLGFCAMEFLAGDRFGDFVRGAKDSPDPSLVWMRWHTAHTETLPSLREIRPEAPSDLVEVIDRLLKKRVAERYPTAADALADLDARQGECPVEIEHRNTSSGGLGVPQEQRVVNYVPPDAAAAELATAPATKKTTGRHADKVHATAPNAAANSSKDSSRKGSSTPPGKTSQSLNDRLRNPWVMSAVIAAMLLPVLLLLLFKVGFFSSDFRDLTVASTPSGATIYVNETKLNNLTDTVVKIKPGQYVLELKMEGFQDHQQDLAISEDGELPELRIKLVPIQDIDEAGDDPVDGQGDEVPLPEARVLVIETIPPGAQTTIDGELQPQPTNGQYEIAAGDHVITLELDGYEPVEERLTIAESGAIEPLIVEFEEATTMAGAGQTDDPPANPLPEGVAPVGDVRVDPYDLPARATFVKLNNLPDDAAPLELVLVEPGPFLYGVAGDRFTGELAGETVDLAQPYYVATTETTAAQFARFVQEQAGGADAATAPADGNLPQTGVAFEQVEAFCRWLSPACRLPTEQQWERAARGVNGAMYPWAAAGTAPDEFDAARCVLRPRDGGGGRLAPVASLPAGAAAVDGRSDGPVFDLIGNAAEWCRDVYEAGYDEDMQTPGVGMYRTIRGASYRERAAANCRATWRANAAPDGVEDVGFRVIVELPPPEG